MVKKRKRSLRHQLRNAVAKDLRTPKYKQRIVKDKRQTHEQERYNQVMGDWKDS